MMESAIATEPAPPHPLNPSEAAAPGDAIGSAARMLDAQPLRQRMRLERRTLRKVPLVAVGYLALVATSVWLVGGTNHSANWWEFSVAFVPAVLLLAFLFESLDAAAGMGFGTALAPLLFALGYDPLEVVPVLLLSESITGLVCAAMHHEFRNVRFSFCTFGQPAIIRR